MKKVVATACFLGMLICGWMASASTRPAPAKEKDFAGDLPPAIRHLAHDIERSHNDGIAIFFRSLEEDCDRPVILNSKYMKSKTSGGVGQRFRIESAVDVSCLRREVWQCRSIFDGGSNGKAVFKYTDCETDAPLVED